MTGKLTILYCRVSSDSQADDSKVSLPEQETKLREYATKKGLGNVRVYHEDYTAYSDDRPQLNEIKALVQSGQVDSLLAMRVDRITREPSILNDLRTKLFIPYQIDVYTIEDIGGPWAFDPFSIYMQDNLAGFSRLWGKLLHKIMTDGLIASVRNGSIIVHGSAHYGFRDVRNPETRKFEYVIVENEAVWIKRIYSWYLSGEVSLMAIRDRLNSLGVPTPSQADFRTGRVSDSWAISSIRNILTNRVYIGQYKPGLSSKIMGLDKLPEIEVPRIVSDSDFESVQQTMSERAKLYKSETVYEYLVNKRITCGQEDCKKSFIATSNKQAGRRRYWYYRHKQGYPCDNSTRHISSTKLDSIVWNCLYEVMSRPKELFEALVKNMDNQEAIQQPIIDKVNEYEDSKAAKQKELDRLVTAYTQGVFELEIVAPRKQAIEDMIASYDRRIAKQRAKLGKLPNPKTVDEIISGIADYVDELEYLSFEAKKRLIGLLDARVILKDEEITITSNLGNFVRFVDDKTTSLKLTDTTKGSHQDLVLMIKTCLSGEWAMSDLEVSVLV